MISRVFQTPVRTFSEEVEKWMRDHDFSDSAELTKLIREWYEACDTPGISAIERVIRLLSMRKLLLMDVDFYHFPPYGRYLNGTPTITYDGMLIEIDTKIQMHNLTNSFNIRSIGSLAAETTVGILQSLYPISQVVIKGRNVPSLMSSVVDVITGQVKYSVYSPPPICFFNFCKGRVLLNHSCQLLVGLIFLK